MKYIGAGIDQWLKERRELIRCMRQLCAVVLLLPLGEPVNDDEFRPHALPDCLDDVGGEAGALDEISAVIVAAAVRLFPEELVHQIAMSAMKFDRIKADFLGGCSRLRESLDGVGAILVCPAAPRW